MAKETIRASKKYTMEDRRRIAEEVFSSMRRGVPCGRSCKAANVDKQTFLDWASADKDIGSQYADARIKMMDHWSEEIVDITEEELTYTDAQGVVRVDGAAVQQNRLRVDSRKWLLSKLRPGQYGDKVTQEITGKDGGPIAVANVDMKNLSDEELTSMKAMLVKAITPNG